MKHKHIFFSLVIGLVLVLSLLGAAGCNSSKTNILFSDDFSDENSGWTTYDDYDGEVTYKDGYFSIRDYADPTTAVYTSAQQHFTDFVLEVETRLVNGTDDNWHVVAFRMQNESSYYDFRISADGYYAAAKFVDGESTALLEANESAYINTGVDAVNTIRIECIGNVLGFAVNGHVLEQITDSTFSGGDISLAAYALSGTFTEVAFDNLVITEP